MIIVKILRDLLIINFCRIFLFCVVNDCFFNIILEIWEIRADIFFGIDTRDLSVVVVMVFNVEILEDIRLFIKKRERKKREMNFGINIFKWS